ncbi:MAG: tetratricopeptide repeat protein [Acidobacteriia bacterium]|nr:tetratricopeptide repeat protein [Terriglobia bacterium]
MPRSITLQMVLLVVFCCGPGFAQQAPPPDSQLPDAPQQQPQAQPPQTPSQPPASQNPEKKPEAKIKKALKRGAPNCIHVGGLEKCKESGAEDDERSAPQQPRVPQNQPLPRSSDSNESSSKESDAPLSPPAGETGSAGDVQELHPYNPHQADKNVEVGDFYFKRNNYRAAESRYAEALDYMPNHAAATYKLAEAQEKLGRTAPARSNYQKYLNLLPHGEFAELAKKGLARLDTQAKDTPPTSPPAQKRR